MPKALSDEVARHRLEVIASCQNDIEAARKLGISRSSVRSLRGAAGIERSRGRPRVTRKAPVLLHPVASLALREMLPTYRAVSCTKPEAAPAWMDLAAGPCSILEPSGRKLRIQDWRGAPAHIAAVKGDSMHPTIRDGELVVMETLNGPTGLVLPALEPGNAKHRIGELMMRVPDQSVVMVSIGEGADDVTLKRVRYSTPSTPDWHIVLVADNPGTPGYPRVVSARETVTFWARVVGLVKE